MNNLTSLIESILFVSNRPLKAKDLVKISGQPEQAISEALQQLQQQRRNSGIVLLESNGSYQLATNPENVVPVKNFLNSDLREKLTDATVEVLAIISYRQPISKAEIEAIRGVNSQYSIRHLLMRGMIERIPNPDNARGVLYGTTTEFLQHLGLSSPNDLPEFNQLVANIQLPQTAAITPEAAVTDGEPEEQAQPTEPAEKVLSIRELSEQPAPQDSLNSEIIIIETTGLENSKTQQQQSIADQSGAGIWGDNQPEADESQP